MSGLAGLYHRDGRPADPILLRRMLHRVAHRGPDASDYWINGPVGMGHVMLHATPESLYERQPWMDESGTICLTLDGRIDNRDDLIRSLEAADFYLRTDTDAELMLRAYQRWGEHCPEHIVGDFAVVVWDEPRRQLFCARDILGLKPFYYCLHGTSFFWASEIPPLFENTMVSRRPNEAMAAEFLSGMVVTNSETVYEGVSRLPPAHTLIVRVDRVDMRRYWTIDSGRQIIYSNDDDYAQHFYELFGEAIRCRLRSSGPIGLELSGGLDSSSVVSFLQTSSETHQYDRDRFRTYSLIFPGMPCDERSFIDTVTAQGTFPSHCILPKPPALTGFFGDVLRYQDLPDHPNGAMNGSLRALARQHGCRVLLTGSGGDEWLTGSFFHYADLLRTFKFGTLLRRLHDDRPLYCDRSSHDLFSMPVVQFGLLPLIPQPCRNLGKWLLRRTQRPDWIDPEFWKRTQMTERLHHAAYSLPLASYAQQDLFSSTLHGLGIHGIELDERAASSFGLESRHPFNDRRLIEFALALPEEQRWGDKPKFILRNAMGTLLPPLIRERVLKADFSCIFAEALVTDSIEFIFQSLAVSAMGWVDEAKIVNTYQTMKHCYEHGDESYRFHVASLWMVFGVELWFRTLFHKEGDYSLRHVAEKVEPSYSC